MTRPPVPSAPGVGLAGTRWFAQEAPGARLPAYRGDPAAVREAARRILARAEFRPVKRPLVLRLLDDLNRLLNDALNRLARGPGNVVGLALLVALLAVLAVLAVRLARRLPRDPSRSVAVDASIGRSPADWRDEAARHEVAGRWRDALRCRYRALIAELAARQLLAEIPGRTSGEYRQEVTAAVPAVASDFEAATDLFELAWYGHAGTTATEAARLAELSGRVVAGVS